MEKKQKKILFALIAAAVLIAAVPFLALRGAEFGGSDDAGSKMAEQIHGEYEPWFTPVLESLTGGEIPGEIESLLFCVTAFFMGRLYERRKLGKDDEEL